MPRSRSNWVVQTEERDGSIEVYGPYTEKQARSLTRRVETFYEQMAKDMNEDDSSVSVCCYELGKWVPPTYEKEPTPPSCPECGGHLGVWHENYGEGPTHGVCNNEKCRGEYLLEEREGSYIIIK